MGDKRLLVDGYKTFNSNWKSQYSFFTDGIPWCFEAAYDVADAPPTMDELSRVDIEMIKLINNAYNRREPLYISKETTDTLLLEAGVIMMSTHSSINWVFV